MVQYQFASTAKEKSIKSKNNGGIYLNNVIKIFKQIQSTTSTNEKINIIKKNSDNELFKKCLVFLLDPTIITGISSKKIKKQVEPSSELAPYYLCVHSTFEDVMNYLKKNYTGTDIDIYEIQSFLISKKEDREFYEQMITKSLRIGCDYKTVNKAIPGLIKVYQTQQAYPLSNKNSPKLGEWFSLSEKINGTNCGIIGGQCISRQGKPFSNMNHIIEEINQLGLNNMYVNGELVRNNFDNIPDDENFQKSISIINSDIADKTDIHFIFYEVLTLEEFHKGKSKIKYKNRLKEYFELENKIKELGLKYIHFINHFYSGTDKSEIQKWLDYANSHNMEGLMLNKDTYWENKRNNGILKVKSFKTCDIRCVGVEEGEGKYTGTLGKIVCNYKGYELRVGSGFTDEQRKNLWTHAEVVIDKIVTIQYKAETKNKDGGISVQFPTFKGVRTDKNEESYED